MAKRKTGSELFEERQRLDAGKPDNVERTQFVAPPNSPTPAGANPNAIRGPKEAVLNQKFAPTNDLQQQGEAEASQKQSQSQLAQQQALADLTEKQKAELEGLNPLLQGDLSKIILVP